MGRNATIGAATSHCGCGLPVSSAVARPVGRYFSSPGFEAGAFRRVAPLNYSNNPLYTKVYRCHMPQEPVLGVRTLCWVDSSVSFHSLFLSLMKMEHRPFPVTSNRSSEHKQRRLGGCGERPYLSLRVWQDHLRGVTGYTQRVRVGLESSSRQAFEKWMHCVRPYSLL